MSTNTDVKKDAFGNNLIIGEIYAYSTNTKGHVKAFYGELLKITKNGRASIRITEYYTAFYDSEMTPLHKHNSTAVVKCNILVPYSNAREKYPTLEQFKELIFTQLGEDEYYIKQKPYNSIMTMEEIGAYFKSLKRIPSNGKKGDINRG